MCGGAGIPEAMTFEPTEEEFADPVRYMEMISPVAHRFGIVRARE